MPVRRVLHYDAFSSYINKGNPAGIVLDADDLDATQMQAIAKKVGFNETVFVMKSAIADMRLRYFTPGHEIPLCGHATIGSMFCLKESGLIHQDRASIETNVGVLPISFENVNGNLVVTMRQDRPTFEDFHGSVRKLAKSLGISREDIDESKPIVYGSTGTWTLLVPIKRLDCFGRMMPKNEMFPEVLLENPRASVHPFCMDTYDRDAMMHARHFSSPYSGTIEDPVTGTASGVMGAYYLTYLDPDADCADFIVEQGQEIDKDGRVFVKVDRSEGDDLDVYISGTGVFVQAFDVMYDS